MKNKTAIEKAFIHFAGDRSVGIPSATFELGLYLDLNDYSDDSGEQHSHLNDVRNKIKDLYENLQGDTPTFVMFDFEMENEIEWDNMGQ